ncbi:hypothetical protein BMF94_4292 [Rhodotorula taiwanensis]|uniref:DASH complex subunit ASK1 n=1 Tax=Rhodotorula taiwanensis TaxID=741276 RepID=A0A2S5B6S6_9BASI|nr:hypothetical protein BMF94_4292 [Rhodotorula taiwanensis]
MPPLRDPNRLWYDPSKPRMLTSEEMARMSPAELQAAIDQIDQLQIRSLRGIDEEFDRGNRIILDEIIPLVEQYGENSAKIYESIKWIKPLMESAASTRLDARPGVDSTTASDAPGDLSHDGSLASPDRTVNSAGDISHATEGSVDGTPRAFKQAQRTGDDGQSSAGPQWSNDMSPFQSVQADLDGGKGITGDYSAMRKNLPDAQRIRLRDLPPDSPDTPQFETMTLRHTGPGTKAASAAHDLHDNSLSTAEPSFSTAVPDTPGSAVPRPRTAAPPGTDRAAHSALLNKVLRKGIDSPSLAKASPARAGPSRGGPAAQQSRQQLPADIPKNWDGIADLSTRGLTAFASPMKQPSSSAAVGRAGPGPSSSRHLMSSPGVALLNASTSTLRRFPASPAPSAALSRTPAKEAARRIAQSVYDATGNFDSPDLPSALKNANSTRLFDFAAHDRAHERPGADSPSQNRSMAAGGSRARVPGSAVQGNESFASLPSQPSFIQRSPTQLFHLQEHESPLSSPAAQPGRTALADFGGGTTANIDELLASASVRYDPADVSLRQSDAAPNFAGIVDDDDGRQPYNKSHDRLDDSFTGEAEAGYVPQRGDEPTFTDFDAAYAQATGRGALRLPGQDGPEDTLFGMPAGRSAATGGAPGPNANATGKRVAYAVEEESDDTFTDDQARAGAAAGGRSGFRLHGVDDMATLHGGELLSSEPFQASPLAQKSHQ